MGGRTGALGKNTERDGYEVNFPLHLPAAAILVIVWLWRLEFESCGTGQRSEPVPAAFASSGKALLPGREKPWVVFSKPLFIGRPETACVTAMQRVTRGAYILDQLHRRWRGLGSFHELDSRVRSPSPPRPRQTRAASFSLDDAKNNNLIFIGSPVKNLAC